MKAEELRIGNILQYRDDERVKVHLRGTPFVVSADDILFLSEQESQGNIVDYVEPINITKELLFKCGFKHHNTDECFKEYKSESMIIEHNEYLNEFNLMYELYNEVKYSELNYVHDIQNLHYILTKEELKIKL